MDMRRWGFKNISIEPSFKVPKFSSKTPSHFEDINNM